MQLNKVLEGYGLVKSQEFSEATVVTYELIFRRFQELVGTDVEFDQISAIDIRKLLKHLRETYTLADRTVHDYWIPLSSLRTWEDELGTEHIIRDKVKRPSYNKASIELFTFDEVKALVQAAEYASAWLTNNQVSQPLAMPHLVLIIAGDLNLAVKALSDLRQRSLNVVWLSTAPADSIPSTSGSTVIKGDVDVQTGCTATADCFLRSFCQSRRCSNCHGDRTRTSINSVQKRCTNSNGLNCIDSYWQSSDLFLWPCLPELLPHNIHLMSMC